MSRTFLALCLFGAASLLEGQITTASISGYVKDSSSAAIPGVTVTAKMVEQQTTRGAQTGPEQPSLTRRIGRLLGLPGVPRRPRWSEIWPSGDDTNSHEGDA